MIPKYTASIEYNEITIPLLSASVHRTFYFHRKLIHLAICTALITAGIIISLNSALGMTCLAFGCFSLPSINASERRHAQQQLKSLKGKSLHVEYYFEENRFICSAEKERNAFRYDTIIRLVKEKGYYYMFPNTNQAYMLDRNTLNPQEEEKFEKFIVKKTDLAWTHGMTFLTMNYKTWKYNQQNTKMKRSI